MKRIATIIFIALFFSACDKYTDLTPKGEKIINTAEEYYDLVVLPTKNYPPFNFRTLVDDNWVKESSIICHVLKKVVIINYYFISQFFFH